MNWEKAERYEGKCLSKRAPKVGRHTALHQAAEAPRDPCANASAEATQGVKGTHFVAPGDAFFQGHIDPIRRVVPGAQRTLLCAEDDPASLFARGKDLIVLAYHLVIPRKRPIMVIPRNRLCRKIECVTTMVYQRQGNLTKSPETERACVIQSMRCHWFCAVRVIVLTKQSSSSVRVKASINAFVA